MIGGQLGFAVITTVDNTVIQSVEFLDTGAQLRITPTIASSGHVLMHIHPELSDGVISEGLPSKTTTAGQEPEPHGSIYPMGKRWVFRSER